MSDNRGSYDNHHEDVFDSGLKMWYCYNCGIGVQAKKLNIKPTKCPRCGNTDLSDKEFE